MWVKCEGEFPIIFCHVSWVSARPNEKIYKINIPIESHATSSLSIVDSISTLNQARDEESAQYVVWCVVAMILELELEVTIKGALNEAIYGLTHSLIY